MALLIGFQLQLKPEIGTNLRSFTLDELQALHKPHSLVFDEIGDH